jgi:hypothetical protein
MLIENYPDFPRRTDSAVFECEHEICDAIAASRCLPKQA